MQEPGSPLRVLLDNEMQAAEEPVWGEDDSRQRIWLLFHFIVTLDAD